VAWMYLLIAGSFEVIWALGMKYTEGFTRPLPSAITILGMVASVYFLNLAEKTIPIGTAYTIWTGIGAVGSVIGGIYLFGESREPIRILFLVLILSGIIGLKMSSKS
jgi:quaternary ammonium compound-resistance protein SugE